MKGSLDTRGFEPFDFRPLGTGWLREFEDFAARADAGGFYDATRKASGQMREVSRTFAGFHLPSAVEMEGVIKAIGRFERSLSDLKARALLHTPPRSRRKVARLTDGASHLLAYDDYPEFLEALASGSVKALRERSYARLTSAQAAYLRGAEDLDAEVDRQAAIVAACDLALEAIREWDPEALRRAEKALRRASRARVHSRTRAYSRPRRRGPCSQPSRHLTQAVRRTHAPPPMRDGNHVEGAA